MKLGLGGLPKDDLAHVVSATASRSTPLAQASILVTGASGFVGLWITSCLVELRRAADWKEMRVCVLARDPESAQRRLGLELWNEVDVLEADIAHPWHLTGPVTHIVHAATPSSVRSGSLHDREVLTTSVMGTDHLIKAVSQWGSSPRILHLSSGAVYGPQPANLERIPESWRGGPDPFSRGSTYAEGKRAAESLLESAAREGLVDAVHARLFAFLGPGLPTDESFAIGNFVADAVNGRVIRVHGDGSTVRSYLDARDLAAWLIRLLVSGSASGAYNVGSPHGRPLADWAAQCSDMSGVGLSFGDAPLGERSVYVPDIRKSQEQGFYVESREAGAALASWIRWLRLCAERG